MVEHCSRSGGDRGSLRMQRGFLTPTLQVEKRYHIEKAGCYELPATAAR
jgi:hypothetical protein